MSKSIFLIADVHFSKTKLKDSFVKPIEEFIRFLTSRALEGGKFDVVIAGDYFDTQLSVADEVYSLATKYLKIISELSDELYIVYGTTSHDRENYDPLIPLFPSNVHFIKTMTNIKLDPAGLYSPNCLNTLFLPEEYPENWQEYYSDALNGDTSYDLIVGHGMILGASMNDTIKIDNRMLGDKGFKTSVFDKIAKQTFFGHIHQQQNLSDNVRYIGSMNKTGFGDESDKGFFELIVSHHLNLENSPKTVVFHKLNDVLDFKTVVFHDSLDTADLDPKLTRVLVSNDVSENDTDSLKKLGFFLKKESDTAKLNRENKKLNDLKFESFNQDIPLKTMLCEVIDNDKNISNKLKQSIYSELDLHQF